MPTTIDIKEKMKTKNKNLKNSKQIRLRLLFGTFVILTLQANSTTAQGLIISFEKVIKTEKFLDSTTIYSEKEFSNVSTYTFVGIRYIDNELYVTYSIPEVNYDSTGFGIKSITGSMKAFKLTENVSLEEIKNVFIKNYQKEVYLPLMNIDTKENAFVILQWKINGLGENQYPYLIFMQTINNRIVASIYKIVSIKKSQQK